MAIPIIIFVVCFGAGTAASARYLPDLGAGLVGGIAFLLVCGLLGAALSLVGIQIYSFVRELEFLSQGPLNDRGEIVANTLRNILFEAGSLTAFAAIVYLLAPQARRLGDSPSTSTVSTPADV
jgi:hypothetical protein